MHTAPPPRLPHRLESLLSEKKDPASSDYNLRLKACGTIALAAHWDPKVPGDAQRQDVRSGRWAVRDK